MLPINATARRAVAALIKQAPLSPGKVEFAWRASVGPAIARVTRVRLESDGVLVVSTDDRRWADEVRRSAVLIGARLDALLGEGIVRHIKAHHA